MGCVCCSLSSFVSVLLDAFERVSVCTVCAMLTCCLMFTILTVLVMGIGIGFHYCFVQTSADAMARAAKATGGQGDLRSGSGNVVRSLDKAVARGITHHVGRRDADTAAQRITNKNLTNDNDTFWLQENTLHNLSQYVTP